MHSVNYSMQKNVEWEVENNIAKKPEMVLRREHILGICEMNVTKKINRNQNLRFHVSKYGREIFFLNHIFVGWILVFIESYLER